MHAYPRARVTQELAQGIKSYVYMHLYLHTCGCLKAIHADLHMHAYLYACMTHCKIPTTYQDIRACLSRIFGHASVHTHAIIPTWMYGTRLSSGTHRLFVHTHAFMCICVCVLQGKSQGALFDVSLWVRGIESLVRISWEVRVVLRSLSLPKYMIMDMAIHSKIGTLHFHHF